MGLLAGFAGPILSLAGLDTCGINLSGFSSSGKSTAQRLAASAWSTPDLRKPALCQTARATDNSIEALAARSNGTVLVLDEVGRLHGKQLAPIIYAIAGGAGKRRMTAEANLRNSHTWTMFVLLSGELSLADHTERDGGEWSAGMAVRIADVDVSAVNRSVNAETLDRITGVERHYGHAGPKLVEALVGTGTPNRAIELRNQVLRFARQLAGTDSESAKIRAAYPFAILAIAGKLARQCSILPPGTDIGQAVDWAWQSFQSSNDSRALSPDDRSVEQLREFIARRWCVSIRPLSPENRIREAEGWYDDNAVYLPTSVAAKATGGTQKGQQLGSILKTKGLLYQFDLNRSTVQWTPGYGRIRSFAFKRSEFGRLEGPIKPISQRVARFRPI
ncbi:MAG: DUF927 domain-containing protein [Pseudomonadota bacterium]